MEAAAPVGGGLAYWMEQMGSRAAFEFHRELVTGFLIPNLHLFDPLVFLAELAFAISFILGFGVRLAGVLAVLFSLHLWLGISICPAIRTSGRGPTSSSPS